MTTLAEYVRAKRRELKLTQQELADQAGVVRQTITALESGLIQQPSSVKLTNIARVLNTDYNQLVSYLPNVVMPFRPGEAGKQEIITKLLKIDAELQEIIKAVRQW